MSKSINRVKAALLAAGEGAGVLIMPDSARTADDATKACKCDVAQIVKSLLFEGRETGELKLVLVSGAHNADAAQMKAAAGEELGRADPKRVRKETGFSIGGVSPIGHLVSLPTYMDDHLMNFDTVWAAAGSPNAVFEISPQKLLDMTDAKLFQAKG